MSFISIEGRFALPQPLLFAKLPPPYGTCRGPLAMFHNARGPRVFALHWPPKGGEGAVPLSAPVSKRAPLRGADFGHVNAAWGRRSESRSRRSAIVLASVCGVLLGVGGTLLIGASPTRSNPVPGLSSPRKAEQAARPGAQPPVAQPADPGDAAPAVRESTVVEQRVERIAVPGSKPVASPKTVVSESGHQPSRAKQPADRVVVQRGREPSRIATQHSPRKAETSAAQLDFSRQWYSEEEMQSMLAELTVWEAQRDRVSADSNGDGQVPFASASFRGHARLTGR